MAGPAFGAWGASLTQEHVACVLSSPELPAQSREQCSFACGQDLIIQERTAQKVKSIKYPWGSSPYQGTTGFAIFQSINVKYQTIKRRRGPPCQIFQDVISSVGL
jgi:hypothetical protein